MFLSSVNISSFCFHLDLAFFFCLAIGHAALWALVTCLNASPVLNRALACRHFVVDTLRGNAEGRFLAVSAYHTWIHTFAV